MKVFSILIILCIFQILICEKPGINQESLQAAFTTSLPFIKSYHPSPFLLYGSKLLSNVRLSYTEINTQNIQFRFDEFGLLHLKFVNLKCKLTGSFSLGKARGIRFNTFKSFSSELSNVNWEETYAVESTKSADGKYDVKFKSMTESSLTFNVFRLVISNASADQIISAKNQINRLNYSPFKNHLKKISGLILETLKNRLK
jgi:hypothetical protein